MRTAGARIDAITLHFSEKYISGKGRPRMLPSPWQLGPCDSLIVRDEPFYQSGPRRPVSSGAGGPWTWWVAKEAHADPQIRFRASGDSTRNSAMRFSLLCFDRLVSTGPAAKPS